MSELAFRATEVSPIGVFAREVLHIGVLGREVWHLGFLGREVLHIGVSGREVWSNGRRQPLRGASGIGIGGGPLACPLPSAFIKDKVCVCVCV